MGSRNIVQPPYSEAKFTKHGDGYAEFEYLYKNNFILSFFDENVSVNFHDYYWQEIEIEEIENGLVISFPAIDIGANGCYYKWEIKNNILVITKMGLWYEGDV